MEINVVSETITTHEYEAKTLAKAFTEITGIKLKHDLIQEGDVVEKLQTQMQSGKNIYDGWINDSDLIGTHFRYKPDHRAVGLHDGRGQGRHRSDARRRRLHRHARSPPRPTGKLYQLPDQQFANLYWFRYDWFTNPDYKAKFKAKYGYELGVPVNWSAYEDIAEFFTNDIKEIDGVKVYGHMDYGKKDPSLGWRFTDAWLSMAGNGDKGLPNGLPVDEWGIRMEGCRPVGSSIERGGDTNGPAAVYSITKYLDWLKKYAPAAGAGHDLLRGRSGAGAGQHRPADVLVHRLHRRHGEAGPAGDERRRHAEVAHGAVAARRLLEGRHEARLPGRRLRHAAEVDPAGSPQGGLALSAVHHLQDRVSLKKSHVGLTFIRESDIWDKSFTERAPKLGGLIEFYRSPARVQWSPDRQQRPGLSEAGAALVAEHRRRLVGRQDPAGGDGLAGGGAGLGAGASRAAPSVQGECGPKLNPKETAEDWYAKAEKDGNIAPQRKLANEKPKGETIDYDTLIKCWPATPPKRAEAK